MKIDNNLFESIKNSLKEPEKQSSLMTHLLRTVPENTYTVRILPYLTDPSKTFFHHFIHIWNSVSTGQRMQVLAPQTFGLRDIIAEERFRLLRSNDESDKDLGRSIGRQEKWLVNVYVVDDPVNPDNNGKVKFFRYGRQLQKIINDAIDGDTAEEFGSRIFDLGPNGCNFKIKVEKQGDFPSYVTSRFTTVGGDLGLSDQERENIYKSAFDLESFVTLQGDEQLQKLIDEHILGKTNNTAATKNYGSVESNISKPADTDVTSYESQDNDTTESDVVIDDIDKEIDDIINSIND